MAAVKASTVRWVLALMGLLASFRAQGAVPPPSSEVKAVFTRNFLEFVKWPAAAFSSPQEAFVIGVSGDAEMVRLLKKAVAGERMGERSVQVVAVGDDAGLGPCHLLYVAAGSEAMLRRIPARRPLLTIGETDAFAAAGGVIRFLTERNRIKVQINLGAARAAELEINSRLLRIADVIDAPP